MLCPGKVEYFDMTDKRWKGRLGRIVVKLIECSYEFGLSLIGIEETWKGLI